jgi:hypothetical protein
MCGERACMSGGSAPQYATHYVSLQQREGGVEGVVTARHTPTRSSTTARLPPVLAAAARTRLLLLLLLCPAR